MKQYLSIFFILISSIYFTQNRVTIEKPNISIEAPEGFEQVEFLEGLYSKATGTSVQIQALPDVVYPFVAKGFTQENLAPQGVKLIDKKDIVMQNGDKGVLFELSFEVKQNKETRTYKRLTLLTGSLSKTIMINVNFPPEVQDLVEDIIKKALLTARFEK